MFNTVGLGVNFLRPVKSGRIEAVGRVVQEGRTIGMPESEITNEAGDLVAKRMGSRMTLTEA